jgi:CRP/FNR family transcriptional regulator, cyclic AMP receptor protein
MEQYLQHLAKVPMFAGLGRKELEEIAKLSTELPVKAGTKLITAGSTAREFFVIMDGEAEVEKDGQLIATVGPGEVQGELSLLLDRARAANVTAKTDMVILVIDRRSFNALLDDIPAIARKMLPVVAHRLADAIPDHH